MKQCPLCGGRAHRSHTRGISEKLFRALTPSRMYRCQECGWRGWLLQRRPVLLLTLRRVSVRTVIGLIVVVIITIVVLYLAKVS